MSYADEEFYKSGYLLGRKPVISTGFPFYARQASTVINQYTFGRLEKETSVENVVKLCCCELAEAIYSQEKQQKASGGKTSEKVGTYSVSFSDAGANAVESKNGQRQIVYKWLSDTGLLYQGG